MSNSAGFTTQAKTSTGTGTNTGTSTGTGTDTGTGTGTGPRTGTKPVGDTTIIDHPEGLTEEELDLEETIEDLDVLIDESIDNEASSIDEDDRGECSQDDDEPSVDDAFEWCRALDDEDKVKIIDTLSATTKANQRWAEGKKKKMNKEGGKGDSTYG